jgi:hypothetical protein
VDPIRLALSAMGAGVAAGLGTVSLVTLGVDLLRQGTPPGTAALGAPLYLLFFGTLGAVLMAGLVAWRLLAPVLSVYRRGGLSMVSALSVCLAMLLCIPAHQLAGRAGLAGLAAGALLVSGLLVRSTHRTAAQPRRHDLADSTGEVSAPSLVPAEDDPDAGQRDAGR